ncbi:MAG: hypothetical protein MI755_13535, partial [Sphingomonadales bacterium]|nr:hypothetical protein [Sphingomonadales bacterium]
AGLVAFAARLEVVQYRGLNPQSDGARLVGLDQPCIGPERFVQFWYVVARAEITRVMLFRSAWTTITAATPSIMPMLTFCISE